ncbi:MAG: hypothetical protein P4M11_16080 [Candidatus Pacebacteria bacterium]|nr:hypothetical protein [Candidatus Paceibacterota bacterium]
MSGRSFNTRYLRSSNENQEAVAQRLKRTFCIYSHNDNASSAVVPRRKLLTIPLQRLATPQRRRCLRLAPLLPPPHDRSASLDPGLHSREYPRRHQPVGTCARSALTDAISRLGHRRGRKLPFRTLDVPAEPRRPTFQEYVREIREFVGRKPAFDYIVPQPKAKKRGRKDTTREEWLRSGGRRSPDLVRRETLWNSRFVVGARNGGKKAM